MSQSRVFKSSMGKDIRFDFETMDISMSDSGLSTIEGKDNLGQALGLRLMTPLGSLPFHPTFGSRLNRLIGKGQSRGVETIGRLMVAETVIREPRILATEEIRVSLTDNGLRIHVSVYSMDRERTEVNAEVET